MNTLARSVLAAVLGGAVLCVAGLAGCNCACAPARGGPAVAPAQRLTGEWTLDRLGGAEVSSMLAAGEKAPSLRFDADGKVSGFGGVNRLFGSTDAAALAAGRLDLGRLASTKMAGPPAAMRLESSFLQSLSRATSFAFDDAGRLTLSDATGTLMRFVGSGK